SSRHGPDLGDDPDLVLRAFGKNDGQAPLLVPKLCLGTRVAKLRFASGTQGRSRCPARVLGREAELRDPRAQAELGHEIGRQSVISSERSQGIEATPLAEGPPGRACATPVHAPTAPASSEWQPRLQPAAAVHKPA